VAGPAAAAVPSPSWVADTLNGEGVWARRRRVPLFFGLMMLFDSWDSIVIAYTLPAISAEWSLGPLATGWLISAGYGGQLVGAIAGGALAERHGRLVVLQPLVVAMSLLALLSGFVTGFGQLVAIRFVQGLMIGGALPISISYVNEVAPVATRGRFFGTFQFFMLSGFGLAAFTSPFVVPLLGWRPMFAIGAAPILLVPYLRSLPESPRWLATCGRGQEAVAALAALGGRPPATPPPATGPAPARKLPMAILASPPYRQRSTVAGLLWFLTSLVSFGMTTWIPSIYVSVFHIPLQQALTYNAIGAIAIFIAPLLLRQYLDVIGRRPPPMIGTAVNGIALLALIVIDPRNTMLVVGVTMIGQIGIATGSIVLWPYTAEIYETRVRAVALGCASSLARGASMLTPLFVGGLLALTGSITPVFLIFGASAIAVSLLWRFGTRETAGREIDG